MKVIFTFDDTDEDFDRDELHRKVHADAAWLTVFELDNKLRGIIKYRADDEPVTLDDVQRLRDEIHDELARHGVTLDGMIS